MKLEISCYNGHKTNKAFHQENIIPTIKHCGGCVTVWGCFRMMFLNWWNHELWSLPENSEEKSPANCLCPEAHLGYAAGQRSKTHQQEKKKEQTNSGLHPPKNVMLWSCLENFGKCGCDVFLKKVPFFIQGQIGLPKPWMSPNT